MVKKFYFGDDLAEEDDFSMINEKGDIVWYEYDVNDLEIYLAPQDRDDPALRIGVSLGLCFI